MRRLTLAAIVCLALAAPVQAQVTITYTFTNGTVANADEVNSNFATLAATALNRTGGTMTGNLLFSADNTKDIGASGATRPRDFFLGRNAAIAGTVTAASVTVTGGSHVAGSVYKQASNGLSLGGVAGSSFDFAVLNPAGSSTIIAVPTGTLNLLLSGNLTSSGSLTSTIAGGQFVADISGGTNNLFMNISNSGTQALIGIESSVGATVFTGTSAYATVLGNSGAKSVQFATNNAARVTIHASGGMSVGNVVDPGATNVSTAGQFLGTRTNPTTPQFAFVGATDTGIGVNSGSAAILEMVVGSRSAVWASDGSLSVIGRAFGTGVGGFGAYLAAGRNSSGGGAPGMLRVTDKAGTDQGVWSDSTGVLRIGATFPSEATGDTGGTIVGTQTSTRDTKNILGGFTDYRGALDAILRAPIYLFTYKGGRFGATVFTGIVADEFPQVMMDPSPDHPEGRSFSPVSAFGYTAAAIKALQQEIDALRNPYARLFRE